MQVPGPNAKDCGDTDSVMSRGRSWGHAVGAEAPDLIGTQGPWVPLRPLRLCVWQQHQGGVLHGYQDKSDPHTLDAVYFQPHKPRYMVWLLRKQDVGGLGAHTGTRDSGKGEGGCQLSKPPMGDQAEKPPTHTRLGSQSPPLPEMCPMPLFGPPCEGGPRGGQEVTLIGSNFNNICKTPSFTFMTLVIFCPEKQTTSNLFVKRGN